MREADPVALWGRPEGSGKITGDAPGTPPRCKAQASKERSAEITSGRSSAQQGLAAACKDSLTRVKPKEERARRDWRMSLYERRRKGNIFRSVGKRHSDSGNTGVRQRSSGRWRPAATRQRSGAVRRKRLSRPEAETGSKPIGRGEQRGQCDFILSTRGRLPAKASASNRTRENRPSGIIGGLGET